MRSVHRHDELVLLGDFNAVMGESRAGLENVLGNFGSGFTNNNSFRLLTFCTTHNLMVRSRWRKQIGMIDDHDECEWVNVSSGTGSPGLSQTNSTEP